MVPCVGVPAEADLESLLRGFQAKDPHSSEAFFEAVSPTLKRMARRYLPSFPIDVREELVGETLMLLQSRNGQMGFGGGALASAKRATMLLSAPGSSPSMS